MLPFRLKNNWKQVKDHQCPSYNSGSTTQGQAMSFSLLFQGSRVEVGMMTGLTKTLVMFLGDIISSLSLLSLAKSLCYINLLSWRWWEGSRSPQALCKEADTDIGWQCLKGVGMSWKASNGWEADKTEFRHLNLFGVMWMAILRCVPSFMEKETWKQRL